MTKRILQSRYFFLFCAFLFGCLFMLFLFRNAIFSRGSVRSYVYDKSSLFSSVEKIYNAVVFVDAYSGSDGIGAGTGFFYNLLRITFHGEILNSGIMSNPCLFPGARACVCPSQDLLSA